jgi:hypothetical protein
MFVITRNTQQGNFWGLQLMNVLVAMMFFYPVLEFASKKDTTKSIKSKIKYQYEKEAKLCKIFLLTGFIMMLSGTLIFLYSIALLGDNPNLFFTRLILVIQVYVGFFLALQGFRMSFKGALTEIKESE